MVEAIKNAVIGAKKMAVIIWCVTAIVVIIFLSYFYGQRPEAVVLPQSTLITAMTLIAAMGGVDVWRQRLFDKTSNGQH